MDDSPVVPTVTPVGAQAPRASQISGTGEDPLDRTVARPAAQRAPWEGARTIAVDDPGFSISKTHVAVIADGTGVLVEDLGSTNGTSVQTPDGALTRASEGRRVRAGVGDVIHVGQRRLMVGH